MQSVIRPGRSSHPRTWRPGSSFPGRLLLAQLAVAGALGAQQTWKVNCSGAYGAHFTDLPPAVAAAAPGDTILVYGVVGGPCGAYYTAPTIDKALHIVGFQVGQPPGNNDPSQVRLRGTLQITGIAPGEHVSLSNIFVLHQIIPSPVGSSDSPIVISDCDGSVLLEDIYFLNLGTIGQTVRIERCDHVVLRGSSFYIGGDPIRIVDSNVLMTNTLVQYDPPASGSIWSPYTTFTESLFLQRSNLTMVASVATGGGAPPMHAVVMDNSTLRIGASSYLRGGLASFHWNPPLPTQYATAYHFVGTGPSSVHLDPRATPLWGPPTTPPITTTIDETFHDWIVADEYYDVRVIGPAGGFAALVFGNMAFPTPSPFGTLGLDPATAFLVDLAALPQPGGVHTWNFLCPSTAPNGVAFCFQCLTLSPTGAFGLTEPSPLTVAWDKTRIP